MKNLSAAFGIDNASLIKALDFLPYPLLVSELQDGEHRNIFVNKKFIEEIGYTCEDIPTITAWFEQAYPDPGYRSEVKSRWQELVIQAHAKHEDHVIQQARIKTKFNGKKWYEVKASLFGVKNIVAFINIDNEIQRERELEILNENKDRTLSILSHDLRSPLLSLYSVLPMLANNLLTESEKSILYTKLSRQVFEVIEFFDTTLQWTRSNFFDHKSVNVRVNFQEIIDKIVSVYHTSIEEKNLNVQVLINHSEGLLGDPEIFAIIIRNLLSNAIKFTVPGGEIKLSVTVAGTGCSIEVENSGKAITQATINAILRKDYRSERGTMNEKGLGVGLILCQQLLERVNGKMAIEAPSPIRTLFRITIDGS